MSNKFVAIFSAAVITVGAIGGVAFASSMNSNSMKDIDVIQVEKNDTIKNEVTSIGSNVKIDDTVNSNENYNKNSLNNPSKDIYQDMIKIMEDNGFKDAARYMQAGNYEAMTDYMNNISQEDYDKMIEIMNNNRYEYMGQMMESIGKEDMIQMHNSMSSMHGNSSRNNMMGGF